MRQIGVLEAKNKFASLLDQVERGAEILITRRGRPIAKLVSAGNKFNKDIAITAANNIRERAKTLKGANWAKWKKYRNENRP